jgi:hypothetical protein
MGKRFSWDLLPYRIFTIEPKKVFPQNRTCPTRDTQMQATPVAPKSQTTGLVILTTISALLLFMSSAHKSSGPNKLAVSALDSESSAHKSSGPSKLALSSLDSEISVFVHPTKPTPGLKCDGTVLGEAYPLVARVLNLPNDCDIDTVESIIEGRLKKAKKLCLSAHEEACFVLGMNSASNADVLNIRIELINKFMSLHRECDPRYGTSCAGFTWDTPFKLLQNKV